MGVPDVETHGSPMILPAVNASTWRFVGNCTWGSMFVAMLGYKTYFRRHFTELPMNLQMVSFSRCHGAHYQVGVSTPHPPLL